ncbi:hypothetical protein ZEAMMB73_Zm00001d044804 [Zea mays]|uniref:K Homology domain-containing protein n=1 Tax=Zea mays TaxID=4577 RepID=A0A1D6NRH5_MAIZE|nr:hypothetical protein ZEAMMB73_Zm00001d044804 [Zea mays]
MAAHPAAVPTAATTAVLPAHSPPSTVAPRRPLRDARLPTPRSPSTHPRPQTPPPPPRPVQPASMPAPDPMIPALAPVLMADVKRNHGGGMRCDELPVSENGDKSIRILCASELIGSVIGKSGANVRRVEQQTGVRIKVQEIDKDASGERLITVSSNEIPTEPISPTIEALILLHDKVAGPPAIARGALTEIASRLRTRTLRDTSTANSPPPFAPSDDPPGILNTVYMNILLASPLLKAILKDATAV